MLLVGKGFTWLLFTSTNIITRDNFFFFLSFFFLFLFFSLRRQKKEERSSRPISRRLFVSVQTPERNFFWQKNKNNLVDSWQWILWRIEHCLRSLFLEIAGNNFTYFLKNYRHLSLVLFFFILVLILYLYMQGRQNFIDESVSLLKPTIKFIN